MTNYNTPSGFKIAIYGVVIVASFLVMAYFVRSMYQEHDLGPLDQARGEERAKVRAELAASTREALNTPGWSDQARGIVRLPIHAAMDATLRAYERGEMLTILTQRVAKAQEPLPEQPSEFE